MADQTQRQRLIDLFESTPILKNSEITKHGIDPKTVQRMVDSGEIRRVSRGLYSLPNIDAGSRHTLVQAQRIVGSGVVCLLSALTYHEIGTQSPRKVWMAIPRRKRVPKTAGNPIKIVVFSDPAFSEGIEEHTIERTTVRIYCAAKTVADCFKYRNKIGNDVAIEALRDVIRTQKASPDELIHFADICRVRNVMMPYLESLI